MRALRFFFVVGFYGTWLWFNGCAAAPKKAASNFSAPSAEPTVEKISAAQTAVTHARDHATAARAAIAQASALSVGSPASPLLATTQKEIDALSNDLLNAQTSLTESQQRIGDLEQKISAQTAALNLAIDEKNAALDRADKLDKERRAAVAQRNKLLFLITVVTVGGALLIFRRPLGALLGLPIP